MRVNLCSHSLGFTDRQIWNGDDSLGQLHVQIVNAEFQSTELELTHLVGLHRINNLADARDRRASVLKLR